MTASSWPLNNLTKTDIITAIYSNTAGKPPVATFLNLQAIR